MSKSKKKREYGAPLLITKRHTTLDDLNSFQKEAFRKFDDWFKSRKHKTSDMVFRIGGCAGSGKTYFVKYLIDHYDFTLDDCYVVAYTGQAVNVLRRSGILAKTIHATFMSVREVPLLDKEGNPITRRGIPVTELKFRPVKSIPPTVKLIICDEASFVPKKLEELMLGYDVPILEIGDPLQLPPVTGKQCFNMDNLDFFMEGIMRQAEDSEIIDLSFKIRHYEPINLADYHNEVRFLWAQPSIEETFVRYKAFIKAANMVITCSNRNRTDITRMYRDKILHATSPYPMKGEKMICRKNDWNLMLGQFPLTNGTQGHAVHAVGKSEVDSATKTYTLDFQPDFISNEYFDGLLCDTSFLKKKFGEEEDYYAKLNPGKKFEYAHAITVHLSQGAQAPYVLFMDAFNRDAEYHMRMRYTAVTRATQRLVYMIPYSHNYPWWTDLRKGGFRPV